MLFIVQNEMDHAIKPDDAGKSSLDGQEIRGLVRTYYRIADSKLRSKLLELCKSLAAARHDFSLSAKIAAMNFPIAFGGECKQPYEG